MAGSRRYKRIKAVAKKHIASGAFSGIEWLILRGGKEWARGSQGQADAITGTDMPESPIYRVYSMTKPVVSTVALMLVEEGRLRLFEPVAAYLPEFGRMNVIGADGTQHPAKTPILIEHLLTHRAGFSYGFQSACPVGQLYRKTSINQASTSLTDMVSQIADLPLAFEPGTQWRYSVATDVLARLIEVALDRPLPEILAEYVTGPLGMSDTAFQVKPKNRPRLMSMYGKSDLDVLFDFDDQPQSLVAANIDSQYPPDDPGFWRGGLGLFSTIDDYALFAAFLRTGRTPDGERLLSRKMVELMWTNRIPVGQMPLRIGPLVLPGYGFGLAGRVMTDTGQALGLTSLDECGWAGAASTNFWIDPGEDLIGITMAQYLGAKVPLADDIRNAVYQALDDG